MSISERNIFTFRDKKIEPDTVLEYEADSLSNVPVVIDNGSHQCRVGWASSKQPQLIFKNITAKPKAKRDNQEGQLLVGNDVANIEVARWQLKSQFDKNIVCQFDVQEQIFDYIFNHLGIDTEGAVNHPVVMTEPALNPAYCRQQISELLFECYHIPHVSYGVDALFSLYKNHPNPESANGLVLSCGHQMTHVLPVLDGRLDNHHSRRINIGGSHLEMFMHRVLQLKYPGHFTHITYNRAEELIQDHCRISADYLSDLHNWSDLDFYDENVHKIQLPYTAVPVPNVELQKEKKEQQAKRLKELRERRLVEKLKEDEEKLEQILQIQQLSEVDPEGFEKALAEANFSSREELHDNIDRYKASIKKATERQERSESPCVQSDQSDAAKRAAKPDSIQVTPKRRKDNDLEQDERLVTDFDGWLSDVRKKRQELLEARDARRQKRADMAKRRTQASQQRMKIISQLAESHKKKKDDTFGMNDEDWNVYKEITKEGGDSDSEAEQERLDDIENLLLQHDKEFIRSREEDNNQLFDLAEYYRLHLSTEQIRIPELFFQPSMIGHEQAGISETIDFVLKKFEPQDQHNLVQYVFLTGSPASFPNFKERLEKDLLSMRPFQSTFTVYRAENPALDAWYGARKWAISQSLPLYSVSRQEYLEMGSDYLKEHLVTNRYVKPPPNGAKI